MRALYRVVTACISWEMPLHQKRGHHDDGHGPEDVARRKQRQAGHVVHPRRFASA